MLPVTDRRLILFLSVGVLLAAIPPTPADAKHIDVTEEAIFDIAIGNKPVGTIVIALFGHTTPKTVKNFATLASPSGFQGHSYRNSRIHRVVPNFVIQGGD